jgi:sulfite exporter TauE/SafE
VTTALPYLALTMGLLSSFHCIGMCGPIALALPVQKGSRLQQMGGLLSYNIGRAFSYAMLGTVIGVFGNTIALMGWLQYVTLAAGVAMLVYALWPSRFGAVLHTPKFWQRSINSIKKGMSALLRSRKTYGWLLLGMLNGLLPCGLVYLALATSVATGSMLGGALFMFAFGLGTMPMMMAVGFLKNRFTPALRSRFHQITPVFVAIAGIWLLMRGTFIEYHRDDHRPPAGITICHGK